MTILSSARRRGLALAVTGAVVAVPALAGPAGATPDLVRLTPATYPLQAAAAAQRTNCATPRLTGRPGVTGAAWRAPGAAAVTVRLDAPGGDWDLAVFDHATGRR